MDIKNIDANSFEQEALKHDGTVVIDFWAPWCGPCKGFAPVFEKYAKENPQIKCFKINVDDNQSIAQKYGIRSIPTTLLIKSGKALKGMAGAMNEAQLKKFIEG